MTVSLTGKVAVKGTTSKSFATLRLSTQKPPQATGLTASSPASGTVNLSWNATPLATSYKIRRDGAVLVADTGSTATTYQDTGLASINHNYTVAGINALGEGLQSLSANATTELPGVVVSGFEGLTVGQRTTLQDPTNWEDLANSKDSIAVTISSDFARGSGTRSTKSYVTRDNSAVQSVERSEIRFSNPNDLPTITKVVQGKTVRYSATDYWYGFAIYVPSTWKPLYNANNGNAQEPILMQMHRTKDNLTNAGWTETENNPPHSLRIIGDGSGVSRWFVRADHNPNAITNDADTTNVSVNCGNVVLGAWTDWVFQVRYEAVTGYCNVWRADSSTGGVLTQVAARTGGFGYYDATPPYLKIGYYQPIWDDTPTVLTNDINGNEVREGTFWYDQFRYYFGNDGSLAHVRPR